MRSLSRRVQRPHGKHGAPQRPGYATRHTVASRRRPYAWRRSDAGADSGFAGSRAHRLTVKGDALVAVRRPQADSATVTVLRSVRAPLIDIHL